MKWLLLIIMSIFFVSGCTMPETKIYSIYLPVPPAPAVSKAATGGAGETVYASEKSLVILIASPRYLSQSYITYRDSPYQLEISRYSKWESTPSDMVKEAFRNYLSSTGLFKEVRVSNIVSEGFYSLELNLKKFERSDEGNDSFGELVFDIKLSSPENIDLYRSSVAKKVRLDDRSFLNLAKGLSSALSESIKETTESIVTIVRK